MNVLRKIFPIVNNYNNLNYDKEGLWSITHPKDADIISETIKELKNTNISILDMTAGCGGNTISFCKYFLNVTSIELNPDRFSILQNNMQVYGFKNYKLICGDSIEHIDSYDVYFIDPPWGGPDYKKTDLLELNLSNIDLVDVIKMIPNNKLIVLKLPYNYNLNKLNQFNLIRKQLINNICILYINTPIE